ncbi:D-glycero-beta-D-manno-heptose 1-phosphate adenylyltransferase [Pedobacter sp. SYSU D00535]|uniref:D-glycero-beta-D-manno-heptose 1-phosphate adenylyltransferase n=1 Tax=Pedobacter sp. SYSU D00535 TaxID=2810308 RepID=UPI001A958F2D|nr:D-glycero-beta-D-manno-heptose 1-phosphate adenylyltransferase [Pedobacter sp. SYSU D00535]
MNNAAYHKIISQFEKSRVLVIGDIILDAYLKGDSTRLSPEAPVPVVNVSRKEEAVGGAANIALNLRALGAEVTFFSAVGCDEDAEKAIALLSKTGVNAGYIIKEPGRKTMVKTRVMAKTQILARFDYGTQIPIGTETEHLIAAYLKEKYESFDVVMIGDYYGGILTPYIIQTIQHLQEQTPKLLAVDSKELTSFKSLRPTLVKPNYFEAIKLAGQGYQATERVEQARETGELLFEKTGAKIVALTMDAEGALIFDNGQLSYRSYAYEVPTPNVVGAGDTFISAYALSLYAGADIPMATEVATAAAAIAVQKDDTAPCYSAELSSFFTINNKIISHAGELKKLAEIYEAQGKKIVFTNGCFDILHSGHVSYLNRAKELGDVLIVGLNCDESVARLKGPDRPINPLEDRMEVLSGLSAIDHIISFGHENEDTPVELIRAAKPHVFAKGGDYTKETLPEASVVEEIGGEIVFVPYVPDHSTTRIIHRINKANPLKLPA